jgi:radical SAM superfamily enzyme YgiQ (UPF0313 family)
MNLNPLGQKRTYSARTPESVVEEIENLDAEIIFFSDDTFFIDVKRSERLCDLIIKQGINKKFIAQSRLEIYKYPNMLRKAEKAGFKIMLVGVESPHDWILKQLNKGFTSQDVRSAFNVLKDYDFYYHCYFIMGNIGESKEEMLCIPQFAKEIGADSISFLKLQARKFSPIKEIVEKTPGYYLTPSGFVYSDRYSLDDLNRIKKEIKKSFYSPSRIYKMIRKLYRTRFVTLTDLLFVLIPRIPSLLYRLIAREVEKKKLKKKQSP